MLKEFCVAMVERGALKIVVDLENCPVMDSTFMGVLSGIACRLADKGDEGDEGTLSILNANLRNKKALVSLGLDQVFEVDLEGESYPEERRAVAQRTAAVAAVPDVQVSKADQAEIMLEAHEALGEINPDNIPRFKDVVSFLREDLDRLKQP